LQRLSPQPSAAPQQKRPDGAPVVLPLQSAEQLRQSSPSPASHSPLPHTAPPEPLMQSFGHVSQISPDSHVPSLSQGSQLSVSSLHT
jgi:hypothetical protein